MLEIRGRYGIGAMHAYGPIAGLRSFGKGANRSILDCLFSLGRGTERFSAAAGDAGAGRHLPVTCLGVGRGGSTGCNDEKGLES